MQSVIEQIKYQLATPTHFNNWLNGLDPQTVVGESLNCSKCPIHTFLSSTVEGIIPAALDVYNTHISYGVYPNNEVVESDRTSWWCRFIHTLDFDSDIHVAYMPINALTCLVALETIDCG